MTPGSTTEVKTPIHIGAVNEISVPDDLVGGSQ
jgi:hypothetical protein